MTPTEEEKKAAEAKVKRNERLRKQRAARNTTVIKPVISKKVEGSIRSEQASKQPEENKSLQWQASEYRRIMRDRKREGNRTKRHREIEAELARENESQAMKDFRERQSIRSTRMWAEGRHADHVRRKEYQRLIEADIEAQHSGDDAEHERISALLIAMEQEAKNNSEQPAPNGSQVGLGSDMQQEQQESNND